MDHEFQTISRIEFSSRSLRQKAWARALGLGSMPFIESFVNMAARSLLNRSPAIHASECGCHLQNHLKEKRSEEL
jgi:hypothetical protein